MAEPTPKRDEIRRFQSTIAGKDVPEEIRQDRCVSCGQPAEIFRDEVSRREFRISGLCQRCQDQVFEMGDDE